VWLPLLAGCSECTVRMQVVEVELAQHGLPALHAEFGHTIATISPVKDALGEVFLSCIDTEYYLHGWPLQVAVLLDGRQPGRVLGPIPGARPVPGEPEMVN